MQSVRNQLHKAALERLITAYADNPVILKIIPTPTPLSSAHLIASLSLHDLVRNMEGGDALPVIRRVLSIVDPSNAVWKYEHKQDHRVEQYKEAIARVDRRLKALEYSKDYADAIKIDEERERLLKSRECFQMVIDYCRPLVKGTLHPNGIPPTTTTQQHPQNSPSEKLFDGWRLRGIFLRLAGPKKATKAGQWRRSAGAISLNSYDFVDGEQANVQIPSRTGTYGLTVRVVWELRAEAARRCHVRSKWSDGVNDYGIIDQHWRLC